MPSAVPTGLVTFSEPTLQQKPSKCHMLLLQDGKRIWGWLKLGLDFCVLGPKLSGLGLVVLKDFQFLVAGSSLGFVMDPKTQ